MAIRYYTNKQQGMIGIAIVFGLGFFVLMLTLMLASGAFAEVGKTQDLTAGRIAFYTAQTDAAEGVDQYLHDHAYTGGPGLLINGASSSSIIVQPWGGDSVKITGISHNGNAQRSVYYIINGTTVVAWGER